jgi:hypothetical protein
MNTFTIDIDNNITANLSPQDAEATAGAEHFSSQARLAKLAATWPAERLVGIWNGIPRATPIKKFKDRQTGVSRIWKAIQSLVEQKPGPTKPGVGPIKAKPTQMPTLAEPEAAVPPSVEPELQQQEQPLPVEAEPATAEAGAAQPSAEPIQAPETAGAAVPPAKAKSRKKAPAKAEGARAGSKTATVLDLMKRPQGVTLSELMTATAWQANSVRGFISGTLGKKMGLTVISAKAEDGGRTYSIKG